jgi:hypothetical protein
MQHGISRKLFNGTLGHSESTPDPAANGKSVGGNPATPPASRGALTPHLPWRAGFAVPRRDAGPGDRCGQGRPAGASQINA